MQLNKIKFFFERENYSTLGLLRVLTALVLLMALINDLPFVTDYFSDEGVLSGHTDVLRQEYRFTVLDYLGSPFYVLFFYFLLIISTIMLLFGKFTRFSAIGHQEFHGRL